MGSPNLTGAIEALIAGDSAAFNSGVQAELQARAMERIDLARVNTAQTMLSPQVEEYDDLDEATGAASSYSKDNHLHMLSHEGDEHHVIKGIPHSSSNADKLRKKVESAGHSHYKKMGGKAGKADYSEVSGDIPFHHYPADHNEISKNKVTKVHANADAYIKHHAKADAEYVKHAID